MPGGNWDAGQVILLRACFWLCCRMAASMQQYAAQPVLNPMSTLGAQRRLSRAAGGRPIPIAGASACAPERAATCSVRVPLPLAAPCAGWRPPYPAGHPAAHHPAQDCLQHARPRGGGHRAAAAAEAGVQCRPGGRGAGALLPPAAARPQPVQDLVRAHSHTASSTQSALSAENGPRDERRHARGVVALRARRESVRV
jgi:hypothetical protein